MLFLWPWGALKLMVLGDVKTWARPLGVLGGDLGLLGDVTEDVGGTEEVRGALGRS